MNEVLSIRSAAGLTQSQLAARSGVAQPNIAAYESGRRRPSASMLRRLRQAASPLAHEVLDARRSELLRIAHEHDVSDVRVFGSVLRRTDAPGSDVDLLVSVPPRTGLMKISAFAQDVEALLGVPVDVVTDGGLRPDHPIRLEAVPL